MYLWSKSRRIALVAVSLLVSVGLTAGLADSIVPIPNLAAAVQSGAPLMVFIPLLGVAIIFAGLGNRYEALELTAARPTALLDSFYIFLCWIIFAGLAAMIQLLGVQPLAWSSARNLAGYLGLGLIGRYLAGQNTATLLPTIVAFVVACLGVASNNHARWWAWPIHQPGSASATMAALGLLVAGLGINGAVRSRRGAIRALLDE